MAPPTIQPQAPGLPRSAGGYWRTFFGLLAVLVAGFGLAAGIAYLVAGHELAKDYFSAHRSVRVARERLVPALAVSGAAGLLLAAAGGGLLLGAQARRLRRPAVELDGVLREVGAGRLPQPGPAPRQPTAAQDAAAALEPLRVQVREIQRLAKEIQTVSLHLHYRSEGAETLTLKDVRDIAVRLDGLARDLDRAAGWFES